LFPSHAPVFWGWCQFDRIFKRERDPVFFFEACEAMFLMAMAYFKKMLFGLRSLDFGEKDER